jgi:hypothetical protein
MRKRANENPREKRRINSFKSLAEKTISKSKIKYILSIVLK